MIFHNLDSVKNLYCRCWKLMIEAFNYPQYLGRQMASYVKLKRRETCIGGLRKKRHTWTLCVYDKWFIMHIAFVASMWENLYFKLKDSEISWRWQSEKYTLLSVWRWDALHALLCKVMVVVGAMVGRQKTSCLHRNSMTHLPFHTWVISWTCLLSNLLTAPRAGFFTMTPCLSSEPQAFM